jgi:DNA-binding SARP family transcriptional activator
MMDLMKPSSVTVRVLGAVELVDAAGEIHEVAGRRLQTLLAVFVAQAGQMVSADALVEAVWPDGLPAAPAAALQTQVFRLRKRLAFPGAPTIATRGPGYALELGTATVDAIEFERRAGAGFGAEASVARSHLHDALSLWRGAPYAGFEDVEPLRSSAWRKSISRRSRRTPRRSWPAVSRTAPSRSWTHSWWSTRCARTRERP